MQLGVEDGYWDTTVPAAILCALCRAHRSDEVVVINVETTAGRFLALLRDHGFEPLLDQFEMVKHLTDHK